MSLGRVVGLSLITHKNATLAESRPVSLAGSTTKQMFFPSTVMWSRCASSQLLMKRTCPLNWDWLNLFVNALVILTKTTLASRVTNTSRFQWTSDLKSWNVLKVTARCTFGCICTRCVYRGLVPPVQVLGQTFVDLESKSISFVCGMQRFVSARERESARVPLVISSLKLWLA